MPNSPLPTGVDVDPERLEIDLLEEVAPTLAGARVLEVGCGDGRLTWRYADRASRVLAIDTDPTRVAAARIGLSRTALSQELARILSDRLGIKDPIGQMVGLPALGYEGGATGVLMRVVGVIRGERVNRDLRLPMDPVAYVPLMQSPRRGVDLIVRTKDDPGAAIPAIREAVRETDPRLALSQVRTLAQIRRQRSLSGAAEPAWLLGAFAALAALLAGLGLYGVLAHSVVQQRREIGIRMALGADRREIVGYVLTRAGGMVALGLVAGLAGAMALGRVMAGLLFEVSPLDPAVRVSAAGLMALVGLAAAALPASRAARVDPTTALRWEE